MLCPIHNTEFKQYTSKTTNKPYMGHWDAAANGMCFPPKDSKPEFTPKAPEPTREKVDSPDWDEIARGKIRSLFIEAHITRNGMVPLSGSELITLDSLVELAMSGK